LKRGEVWWADLGPYRLREQTGRRPVVIWQSNTLTQVLQSVLVIPLTTNMQRANLAGTGTATVLLTRRSRKPISLTSVKLQATVYG